MRGAIARQVAATRVEHEHAVAGDRERAGRAADRDRRALRGARCAADSRVTVPSPRLATHTEPCPTAMSCGSRPTGSRRPITTSSRGSIRATVPSPALTTHTKPAPTASAAGKLPVRTGSPSTRLAIGSMRVTVPASPLRHPRALGADGDVDGVGADAGSGGRCRARAGRSA